RGGSLAAATRTGGCKPNCGTALVSMKEWPRRAKVVLPSGWSGEVSDHLPDRPNRRATTMLYLGIDQHARQLTISLRDESGDVVLARQVSTEPEKVQAFFQQLTRERLRDGESFVAVLEVCGFNDWLIRMLHDYRCHKVILIQPDDRKKCKTDRRD